MNASNSDLLALLPLIAPLSLAAVGVLTQRHPGPRPRPVLAAARWVCALSVGVAVATAAITLVYGPFESMVLGAGGLGLSVRLDGLSAAMLLLVSLLGAAVVRFSANYLDGDARHGRFMGHLALTIACVMLLVLSGNLLQLVVMWVATSLSLHWLLVFYPERPGAVIAARKKFLVARLGDVALAIAALLLGRAFGTADIGLLIERAAAVGAAREVAASVQVAAVLLVLTAALKSAQFPTHGWLAEVMETPTPVSALLHAGILNGGIFLVARLAPVVRDVPAALEASIVIGGFTALFASVVMITQSSVKVALAYSSAAHMGFMLFLCGVGAYTVAIVHLVAHSFYKAHAFLSAGSAIDLARSSAMPGGKAAPRPLQLLASLGLAVAIVLGVAAAMGVSPYEDPVALGLAAVLSIGLTQLLAQGLSGRVDRYVAARTALAAAGTALAFYTLEHVGEGLLSGAIPVHVHAAAMPIALMVAVIAAFGLASALQLLLPVVPASRGWDAAWVHVRNGLYANAFFDRLIGALRLGDAHRSGQEES